MKWFTASILPLIAFGAYALNTRSATAVNPLSMALATDLRFTGQVEERLEAGSYVYLHVRDDAGQDYWLAALRMSAAQGPRVSVQAYARADHFESRRTGRAFDPLYFASVTTPNPESP